MKNKVTISKSIALVLCIITMIITFNIYLSYKDLYVSDNLPRDSIIYIAAAKASLKNLGASDDDKEITLTKTKEIGRNKSSINLNKENIYSDIFTNILMLLLSFISLASVHNAIINTKEDKKYNSKNLLHKKISKNPNKKSSSSLLSKEGAK
ncbi:hypothetical protein [Alkaliphilus oremlandii]|uniref:Uncharacterized protein n=1 Tax=Alkaliphilus oremlandii (strain OhILAs) TaxID=350688 RepID=A8MGC1_ALKOO|nr:hypothetical protein [Alkaliphilus oremlandii]ABW18849.1 hypothetical protein Clos_1304 [Alkaliphilus oremlandii OhILAs]